MSVPPISYSYADAAQTLKATVENETPLAFPVDQRGNENSSTRPQHQQRLSVVTIEEPASRPPLRGGPSSSGSAARRPSHSRRTSIADVLSKITSYTSESPSRVSVSSDVAPIPEADYEEGLVTKSGRKGKKKRPRNRRRRSTHGDFLVAHNRGIELQTNPENETPLIKAISDGDVESVRSLLQEQSTFAGTRTLPLQEAAIIGNEEIVTLLLDSGKFDVNARDERERTALYAATARSNDGVAKLLLHHNAIPLSKEEARIAKMELKRWRDYESQMGGPEEPPLERVPTIKGAKMTDEPEADSRGESSSVQRLSVSRGGSDDGDHIYRLEIGSCENVKEMEDFANRRRQSLQQKGEWVTGPLKTPELSPEQKDILEQHKHARYPGFGFNVPVVEFQFVGNTGHRIVLPTPTIDELLYGNTGAEAVGRGSGFATGRWYHLPANHLGWAEDLIRKIYEKRNPKEQQKRDVILSREPFSSMDNDIMNPTRLDPRPQARSLRPVCRSMTLDRDGTQRLSTCISLHVPFAHWETEENRAEMHHVMEVVRSARKDDIDRPKGASKKLPSNSVIQNRKDWNKNEKMLCAYLYNNPPVHPRRTLDQFYYHMLEDTEHRDQDQVIPRFYRKAWNRQHNIPEDEYELEPAIPGKGSKSKYKFSLDPPKDDSTFQMSNGISKLSPTSPHGLVPSPQQPGLRNRKSKKVAEPQEISQNAQEPRHVLMVDQLWLWILDENTIITSFPQNWTHEDDKHKGEKDHLDVLQSIHEYLSLVNRPPLDSVYDLAQLIVYKCLATFCSKPTPYGAMQILDVYEMAIASVTDKETKIFSEFAAKAKEKRPHDQSSSDRDHCQELYNIDEEIEQLKEIKDIQDELHILSVLLHHQSTVLCDASKALEKQQKPEGSSSDVSLPLSPLRTRMEDNRIGQAAPYSSKNNFGKLHAMVIQQDQRRKGLEVQAEQANKDLNHLLDLKQKQANVSEARSARWTAESTKQQGNIMVLFTLVTIIFAPLSLMGTIFSLRIVEFPDILHRSYVLKYMFVVSIAVIIPLAGLVIYTTRVAIGNVFWRLGKWMVEWKGWKQRWWEGKKEHIKDKWDDSSDSEGEESDAGLVEKHEDRVGGKRFWRKKVADGGLDAEKAQSVTILSEK